MAVLYSSCQQLFRKQCRISDSIFRKSSFTALPMKCNSTISDKTSMSIDLCSLKLRIFTLVITTADLINERTTPTMDISHAVTAPIALFTTYIFLGVMVFGGLRHKDASFFLQVYAIVSCCSIQTMLSIVIFKDLIKSNSKMQVGLILNGVLPMLIIILLISDLIVILFSNRDNISAPAMPIESRTASSLELPSIRS